MSGNIFTQKYGVPKEWKCVDCGVMFIVYPGLPFDHACSKHFRGEPKVAYYFYRINPGDDRVAEFCVLNAADPNQYVESHMPDGTVLRWDKRIEGDLLVFKCPAEYDIQRGLGWRYDRRLQVGRILPDEIELRRLAMRGRVSA